MSLRHPFDKRRPAVTVGDSPAVGSKLNPSRTRDIAASHSVRFEERPDPQI